MHKLPPPPEQSSPHSAWLPSAGPRPLAPAREISQELDWRTYVGSIARHKRMIALIVVLGLALGVAASRFLRPTYAAAAELWIEVPKDASGNPGPAWSNQILGSTGWVDLLRSDVIVVDAVRTQRLYLDADSDDAAVMSGFTVADEYRPGAYRLEVDETGKKFTFVNDAGDVELSGAVGDSIGRELGFIWVPPVTELTPGRVIEFDVISMFYATQKLLDNLQVRPGRDRSYIKVEVRGTDPAVITSTVNSMARHLVELASDLKRQRLTDLTRILGGQLRQADSSLRDAEAEHKAFRARTATLAIQDRNPASTGFVETRLEQEQARSDREAIAQVLASTAGGGSLQSLGMIGTVARAPDLMHSLQQLTVKEAELRVLRRRYTDAYSQVQQLAAEVESERSTIRSLAAGLAAELAGRETRLSQRIQAASEGLREMSPLPVEEARLARNVSVAADLYTNLRERHEEARLAEVSVTPDIRLLDPASMPEEPLYDRAPLAIVLALFGSLGAGVVSAIAVDLLDPKLRYPTQIARELGLPVLGVVPHVLRNGKDRESFAPVIEALRGVRLNVLHAHGAAGPLLLTVTSPGMGDGKSFITSNLALAFADARYRTLLIDGDIRRGSLHRVLNAARKPGLTDHLADDVPAAEIVQSTAYPNLSFIASGTRRHAGPELLSSAGMARFIASVRSDYDVILVDSSPLAAGVDPYALATLTGNLMMVLRSGVTNRQLAETKLGILGRLPVRILGSVVNDVPPGGDYEYYSYYLAGYELDEEVTSHSGAGRRILPQGGVKTGPIRGWGAS